MAINSQHKLKQMFDQGTIDHSNCRRQLTERGGLIHREMYFICFLIHGIFRGRNQSVHQNTDINYRANIYSM